MRVLVTGATGNVGTALLRRLQEESVEVVAVSRRLPLDPAHQSKSAGVQWHSLDLAEPGCVGPLTGLIRDVDAVVHLAWQIQPSHDEAQLAQVNLGGTHHVLSACDHAGVGHVVHASSVGAYSSGPKQPVSEAWPTHGVPSSSYSRHKARTERMLDSFQESRPGVAVARLRPGLIFQRGAASEIARYFLGPLVPARMLSRLRLPVAPIPHALVFQAVHADDVADAYWRVLTSQSRGAFNVAADPALGPEELAKALGARRALDLPLTPIAWATAATWALRLQPTDRGWVDLAARSPLLSTARIRDELGWQPQRSAEEALADLLDGLGAGAHIDTPPLRSRVGSRWQTQ